VNFFLIDSSEKFKHKAGICILTASESAFILPRNTTGCEAPQKHYSRKLLSASHNRFDAPHFVGRFVFGALTWRMVTFPAQSKAPVCCMETIT
jgi:hypothetical protein